MNTTFYEIHKNKSPKLKTNHFIVDNEFKHVEKPSPSVASYMVFVGKSRSGKSSHNFSQITHLQKCFS